MNHDAVKTRHLRGFRKIQREILKAMKAGVPHKDYRSLSGAYREAVAGERMVLGTERPSGLIDDWPDEMVVRWVDDEETEGEEAVADT